MVRVIATFFGVSIDWICTCICQKCVLNWEFCVDCWNWVIRTVFVCVFVLWLWCIWVWGGIWLFDCFVWEMGEKWHILTFACACGSYVDMNIQRNDGITALFMAAQEGHKDVVELLADKGAGTSYVCVSRWAWLGSTRDWVWWSHNANNIVSLPCGGSVCACALLWMCVWVSAWFDCNWLWWMWWRDRVLNVCSLFCCWVWRVGTCCVWVILCCCGWESMLKCLWCCFVVGVFACLCVLNVIVVWMWIERVVVDNALDM